MTRCSSWRRAGCQRGERRCARSRAQGPREPGDLPTAQDKLSKGSDGVAAGLAAFQAMARKNAADADGRFDSVALEAWRVEFYAASTDEPDAQRKAFGRACKDLVKGGRLKVHNNIYSLTNGIEAQYLASSIRTERAAAGVVEPVQAEGQRPGSRSYRRLVLEWPL